MVRRKMAKRCLLEASSTVSKKDSQYRNTRARLDALRYESEAKGLSKLAADLARKSVGRRSKTAS
jgi:hypothetical protein